MINIDLSTINYVIVNQYIDYFGGRPLVLDESGLPVAESQLRIEVSVNLLQNYQIGSCYEGTMEWLLALILLTTETLVDNGTISYASSVSIGDISLGDLNSTPLYVNSLYKIITNSKFMLFNTK